MFCFVRGVRANRNLVVLAREDRFLEIGKCRSQFRGTAFLIIYRSGDCFTQVTIVLVSQINPFPMRETEIVRPSSKLQGIRCKSKPQVLWK